MKLLIEYIKSFFTRWKQVLYIIGISSGLIIFISKVIAVIKNANSYSFTIDNLILILIALVVLIIVRTLQMISWRLIMLGVNVQISYKELFKYYTLSMLPRYVPGGFFGYLTRSEWMQRKYDLSYLFSSYVSIIELFVSLIALFQVFLLYWMIHQNLGVSILLTILFISSFLAPNPIFTYLILKTRIKNLLLKINSLDTENLVVNKKYWFMANSLYFTSWLGFGIAMNFVLASFHLSSNYWSWIDQAYWYGLSWFIGFIILFVPSGLGIREHVYSSFLIKNLNISVELANFSSILSRFLVLASEVAWLLFALIIIIKDRDKNIFTSFLAKITRKDY